MNTNIYYRHSKLIYKISLNQRGYLVIEYLRGRFVSVMSFFVARLYLRGYKTILYPLSYSVLEKTCTILHIPCIHKRIVHGSIKEITGAIKTMTNQPALPVRGDGSASLTDQPRMAC